MGILAQIGFLCSNKRVLANGEQLLHQDPNASSRANASEPIHDPSRS